MNIITTKRLILRNTKLEDIDTLHDIIFKDPTVVKYTFGSEIFNYEDTAKFINENCNFDKKLGLSTLIEKQTNNIIGLAGVMKVNYLEKEDYEFGFILSLNSWGKGYAKEIGDAQIEYIKTNLNTSRAIALVHKQNASSLKCIEKLGLKYLTSIKIENRGNREVYSVDFLELL